MPATRPISNYGSSRLVRLDTDYGADLPQARSSSPMPSTQETPLPQDQSVLVPSAVITVLTAKPFFVPGAGIIVYMRTPGIRRSNMFASTAEALLPVFDE
jgi:hypothetical protein